MRRYGRTAGLLGVLALALIWAAVAVTFADRASTGRAASVSAPGEHFSGPITLKSNKADAARDARYLVGLVRLPAGTMKDSSYHPSHLHSLESVLTPKLYAARFWVPRGYAATAKYLHRHPPGGVKSDGGFGSPATGWTSEYDFHAIHGRVFARLLAVTLKASGSRTKVLVEAQSNWMLPRLPDTMVPRTAAKVLIGTSVKRHALSSTHVFPAVTSEIAVHRLTALFNVLQRPQEAISEGCWSYSKPVATKSIRLRFLNRRGRLLATVTDHWPEGHPSVAGSFCGNPFKLQLTTGHHVALEGNVLTRIQRLTGFRVK